MPGSSATKEPSADIPSASAPIPRPFASIPTNRVKRRPRLPIRAGPSRMPATTDRTVTGRNASPVFSALYPRPFCRYVVNT